MLKMYETLSVSVWSQSPIFDHYAAFYLFLTSSSLPEMKNINYNNFGSIYQI